MTEDDEFSARRERAEQLRKRLKPLLPKGTWRQAADRIGVSNTALGEFLSGKGGVPQEATLDRYEKLLTASDRSDTTAATESARLPEPSELERQIDEIMRSEMGPLEKACLVAEISAAYRARALDREGEAARIRAKALDRAERRALVREWKVSSCDMGPEDARALLSAFLSLEGPGKLPGRSAPTARRQRTGRAGAAPGKDSR